MRGSSTTPGCAGGIRIGRNFELIAADVHAAPAAPVGLGAVVKPQYATLSLTAAHQIEIEVAAGVADVGQRVAALVQHDRDRQDHARDDQARNRDHLRVRVIRTDAAS